RAADNTIIVAYTNMTGGQDELVFDGDSLVYDQDGELAARGRQFEEDLVVVDLDLDAVFHRRLHDPRRRQGPDDGAPVLVSVPGPRSARRPLPLTPPAAPLEEDAEI